MEISQKIPINRVLVEHIAPVEKIGRFYVPNPKPTFTATVAALPKSFVGLPEPYLAYPPFDDIVQSHCLRAVDVDGNANMLYMPATIQDELQVGDKIYFQATHRLTDTLHVRDIFAYVRDGVLKSYGRFVLLEPIRLQQKTESGIILVHMEAEHDSETNGVKWVNKDYHNDKGIVRHAGLGLRGSLEVFKDGDIVVFNQAMFHTKVIEDKEYIAIDAVYVLATLHP